MSGKSSQQKCVLMLIADGFSETEAVVILSALRKAGIYAKSAGLTSGLISGAHGILIMPDFTLTDLERSMDLTSINMVVLPVGEQNLSSLEVDPRVHRILRQVIAQAGNVVTNSRGAQLVITAIGQSEAMLQHVQQQMIVRYEPEQSVEAFAQDLVRRV